MDRNVTYMDRSVTPDIRTAASDPGAIAPAEFDPTLGQVRAEVDASSLGQAPTEVHWTVYESPVGPLTLVAGPGGITNLSFPGQLRIPSGAAKRPMPEATRQLDAYFAAELRGFELPLDLHGTQLEKAVWRALLEIPYGETVTYGEQTARIDPSLFDPTLEPWQRPRVVGAANGRNPVAIVVPCHRVVGADGSLTGYGGGLHRKRALLELESSRQLAIL